MGTVFCEAAAEVDPVVGFIHAVLGVEGLTALVVCGQVLKIRYSN